MPPVELSDSVITIPTPPQRQPAIARAGTATDPVELRSPPLREKLLDFLPADLDGDGFDELVLLGARFLAVWRYEKKAFTEIYKVNFKRYYPARVTTGRLAAQDTDNDGAAEVFISLSTARQGGVFRWQEGVLAKIAPLEGTPVAFDENGNGLFAQFGAPFTLSGASAKWKNLTTDQPVSTFLPPMEDFLELDRQVGGGLPFFTMLDKNQQLKVRSQNGLKVWMKDRVGLGLAVTAGQQPGHLVIFNSQFTLDPAKDALRATYFDRRQLIAVWQGKPLGGRVTRLHLGDYDGDGVQELLALVERGQFPFFETSLVAVDLSKVPAVAGRAVLRP